MITDSHINLASTNRPGARPNDRLRGTASPTVAAGGGGMAAPAADPETAGRRSGGSEKTAVGNRGELSEKTSSPARGSGTRLAEAAGPGDPEKTVAGNRGEPSKTTGIHARPAEATRPTETAEAAWPIFRGASAEFAVPSGVYAETVTMVEHHTNRLFKFRITRPASFRFRSGEFVMIGLPNSAKPVYRAYSIASPSWDEEIEFYSIKVPGGPLTEHLQKIEPGDTILMRKKPTGTLVNDALLPGKRLYMFSTGTGIAPFASLVRDPETYEKFNEVVLTHTCREEAELKYGFDLIQSCLDDPLIGEFAAGRLRHYASCTRADYPFMGRITDLIKTGKFFEDIGAPPISPDIDRGMICGSMAMLNDTKTLLEGFDLVEGSNGKPGTFVVERAFVD